MKALIDADILRYEIGYAAEASVKAVTEDPEALPSWEFTERLLHQRIDDILEETGSYEEPVLYLTTGPTFRDEIATKKGYKAQRISKKPWHFDNLTLHMRNHFEIREIPGLEADDVMAIDHSKQPELLCIGMCPRDDGTCCGRGQDECVDNIYDETIICSRDKDLRQVPGWFYSWELGRQPSFGPEKIDKLGYLRLSEDRKKLTGTGLSFFYAQCLMGDVSDNVPGLPSTGLIGAFEALDWISSHKDLDDFDKNEQMFNVVLNRYRSHYGHEGDTELLEQGRLLWMTRRLNEDGSPVLWELGMTE